jgi:DNA-binding XRE family transcriptional regulator
MANMAKVLKDEIARIAKRQLRAETVSMKKDTARLKRDIAALKRRLHVVERDNRQLVKRAAQAKKATDEAPVEDNLKRFRPTGQTIITLRNKLGLTQGDLGKLLGVTAQSIYQYETREGKLSLRQPTKIALARIKKIGKREALRLLEEV